jgi:multisubunit Na+/H+ antiporter MnhG subunit
MLAPKTFPVQLLMMIVLITCVACFLVYDLPPVYTINNAPPVSYEHTTLQLGIIIILIGETIVWWRMRKLKYHKGLFAGYFIALAGILILLPVEAWLKGQHYHFLAKDHILVFFAGVVFSHVCLIGALRQAYAVKGRPAADPFEAIDELLD